MAWKPEIGWGWVALFAPLAGGGFKNISWFPVYPWTLHAFFALAAETRPRLLNVQGKVWLGPCLTSELAFLSPCHPNNTPVKCQSGVCLEIEPYGAMFILGWFACLFTFVKQDLWIQPPSKAKVGLNLLFAALDWIGLIQLQRAWGWFIITKYRVDCQVSEVTSANTFSPVYMWRSGL